MMKRLLLTFLALVGLISISMAQLVTPVKWTQKIEPQEVKAGETATITFEATIIKDWYLYSSDFDPDLGPMVTTFKFTPDASYELIGELTPVNPKRKYDKLWEGEISYFKEKGVFTQKVKILDPNYNIEIAASGQACSDVTGQCVPFNEGFAFAYRAEKKSEVITPTHKEKSDNGKSSITVGEDDSNSIIGFMISAFLFGLAAIFTPCVFPMIPLTVSFFTNQKGGKGKALFYGTSIIIIYTLVGAVLAPLSGDPSIANLISTHWLPNILFFAIFIVFAISFFGAFEITMPSSIVNKMDSQSSKGGVMAVFFMAFTLVLVSFSCTGPIVGTILIESVGGHILRPMAGMFAFALAFALPFTVFALFPKLLDTMPQSGGWLNSVKVVLGFVELALAFKFLSMVDLVYHWDILNKDVMVAIWIVLATMLGFYLLGKIRLPHDSPTEKVTVPRLLLSIVVFSFVVYMIPGLFGAPLNLLSGILPPQSHHGFDVNSIIRKEVRKASLNNNSSKPQSQEKIKWASLFKELPHGLNGYFNYEQALAASKREGKPLFIDFTGHGCANCRKMEANVWSDPAVLERLEEDYIVVALYVDEPKELPESEWKKSTFDGKMKKTVGAINFDFQITKFNSNAQPFYCLLNSDGELLIKPKAYDLNVNNFVEFLDKGVEAYKNGAVLAQK